MSRVWRDRPDLAARFLGAAAVIALGKCAPEFLGGAAEVLPIGRCFAALPGGYARPMAVDAEVHFGSHPELSEASFETQSRPRASGSAGICFLFLVTLASGTRLGPYEIVAAIGAGGMGEVYRARDTRLGRTIAIKVLPPEYATNQKLRVRFEREARTISSLNHPHICALHDLGRENGIDFLVLEYCEGSSLAEWVLQGPLSIEQILQYGVEIADALYKAHRQGIIHRDLKPSNIMLTTSGVKLLDFGLAKSRIEFFTTAGRTASLHEPLTEEGKLLGTIQYMAPEVLRGKQADSRSDIFSLGLVLYEMSTGQSAFAAESKAGLIAAILAHNPQPIRQIQPLVPPQLEHLIQKCLAKDPEDRWQSAHDVAEQLRWLRQAWDKGETAETAPSAIPSIAQRITPAAKRRRILLIVTGLALAAAFGGAVALRVMRRDQPVTRSQVIVRRLTEFLGLENFPALSPDGRSLAFTADTQGRRQIWVRLVSGGPPLQLTRDDTDHLYPRWSHDSSSLIYFTPGRQGEEAGSIWEISALGGSPRRVASSLTGADLSPTDELAFVRLSSGKVELVAAKRGSDLKVLAQLETGYLYGAPRWSPDGRFIAYERRYHGTFDGIFVVSLGKNKARQLTAGQQSVNGFAWLPDSSGIVFSSGRGSIMHYLETFHLWVLRLDEEQPRQLTFGEDSHVQPDINRSGALVATRIRMRSDLWRFPVDGEAASNVRAATPVTRQTAEVRVPSVSPDGREIVYLSDIGGHSNLRITNIETGEARQLTVETDPGLRIGVPLWSPDGRRIAFYWVRQDDFGYSTIFPDGSGLKQVVSKGWWVCWSADSRWLYYQDQQGTGRRLMKIPADGGSPVVVRAESATMPALSPDGATLYFVVEVPRATGAIDYEIRSASPENGPSRVLARILAHRTPGTALPQFHPVISPDGRWLAIPLVDGSTTNIWAVSTSEGTMRQITEFGGRPIFITRRVSWSPDARSIYAAVSEGDADIVLLDGLRP